MKLCRRSTATRTSPSPSVTWRNGEKGVGEHRDFVVVLCDLIGFYGGFMGFCGGFIGIDWIL